MSFCDISNIDHGDFTHNERNTTTLHDCWDCTNDVKSLIKTDPSPSLNLAYLRRRRDGNEGAWGGGGVRGGGGGGIRPPEYPSSPSYDVCDVGKDGLISRPADYKLVERESSFLTD